MKSAQQEKIDLKSVLLFVSKSSTSKDLFQFALRRGFALNNFINAFLCHSLTMPKIYIDITMQFSENLDLKLKSYDWTVTFTYLPSYTRNNFNMFEKRQQHYRWLRLFPWRRFLFLDALPLDEEFRESPPREEPPRPLPPRVWFRPFEF